MSKKSNSIYLVPILAACVTGGIALYMLEFEPTLNWKMTAIIFLSLLLLVIPLYRSYRKAQDTKKNIPLEDEMSRLLEIHAGAYSFRYSMMSWFAIFILRDKFPDTEEMLGIGIMAAAAIYGLTWLNFKRNGIPHADPK